MVDSSSTDFRVASVAAGQVAWLEAGEGPPLVLLHGIGSGARSWRAQLDGLSDGFRTVAWNAPGYGESPPLAPAAPSAADYASTLAAFLDAMGVARCHLVGHSLGCLMAARFAADHSPRVASLTLASIAAGHARLDPAERARLLRGRIEDVETLGSRGMAEKRGPRLLGPDATPAQIRAVVDAMASVDPSGYAQAARMLSNGDILEDLARLPAAMPVQIIYGSADVITPPRANLRVAETLPRARVTEIPGAGHALAVQHGQEFNAALRDFIGGIDA